MKHRWAPYILTFICSLAVFWLVLGTMGQYQHENVLEEIREDGGILSTSESTGVIMVLVLLGIHCVSMFVANRSWRRRALYITRLEFSPVHAIIFFLALLLGPALVVGFFFGLSQGIAGNDDDEADLVPGTEGPIFVSVEEIADEQASDLAPDDTAEEAAEEAAEETVEEAVEEDSIETYALLITPPISHAILVLIVNYLRSRGRNAWRGFGLGRARFWWHVGTGIVAYLAFRWAVLPVLATLVEFAFNLVGVEAREHEAIRQFQDTGSLVVRLGLIVSISLAAPFFEEIIFRGLLFQTLKRFGGSTVAIIVSAVIFAAFHGTAYVIVNIFFLGLFFGYLVDRTGSIVPGIVLHFLFNTTAVMALVLG